MNRRIVNLTRRAYSSFGALMSGNRLHRPLMSMTMHEWSELTLDMKARRSSVIAGSRSAGIMKLTLDVHAELSKDGVMPNINAFNRLIALNTGSDPEMIFDHLDINDDSRFQQNMSLFACMEQEPLNLKPNEKTFELAMANLYPKSRMITLTEALFQLMQTPAYGLKPTRLCWILRVAAVMTKNTSIAAEQYYREFISTFPLDRRGALALVKAAVARRSWDFLYNRLLPDIDACASEFTLDECATTRLLGWPAVCSLEGVPLIRWALKRDILNKSSDVFFNEPLCLRWLSWIASSELGAGVSDIAEAAMQRILDLCKDSTVSKMLLEMYLRIMEVEESGALGEIARFHPTYGVPVTPLALALAARIREELRRHQAARKQPASINTVL